jgi:hypothetical protein
MTRGRAARERPPGESARDHEKARSAEGQGGVEGVGDLESQLQELVGPHRTPAETVLEGSGVVDGSIQRARRAREAPWSPLTTV